MIEKKYFIFDIDGTLTRENDKVSNYTLDILKEISKENGIVFCTGRNVENFKIDLPKGVGDYLIGSDGSFILDLKKEEIIMSNKISKDDISKLLKYKQYIKSISASTIWNFYINTENCNDIKDLIKIDFLTKEININEFINLLQNELNDSRVYKMRDSHKSTEWIIVTNKKSSKANTLNYLLKMLNTNFDNTIYFGDSYTDIEPMQLCSLKICPANAINEVKTISNYITEPNNVDGIARYIYKNFLQNNKSI